MVEAAARSRLAALEAEAAEEKELDDSHRWLEGEEEEAAVVKPDRDSAWEPEHADRERQAGRQTWGQALPARWVFCQVGEAAEVRDATEQLPRAWSWAFAWADRHGRICRHRVEAAAR